MNQQAKILTMKTTPDRMQGLSIDIGSTVLQFVRANPLVSVGLAGAAVYLVYSLFKAK